MKKTHLLKAFPRIIVSLAFVTVNLTTYSQAAPDHKPYMWVPMDQGQKQINLFNSLKLPKIEAAINAVQTNRFVLGNFFGMFQYLLDTYGEKFVELSVHIGVCTGDSVPVGYDNKLILIFQPVVTGKDVGYFILPKPFNSAALPEFQRASATIEAWTSKYTSAMPLTTITTHPDNVYEDRVTHLRRKSDTKYVTYCVKDFTKFYNFQKYYATQHNLSSNLIGYLASYLDTGNHLRKFKKRILTEFNFVDNNGQDFYLEQIAGFMGLPQESSACSFSAKFAGDNGQLCPTYCPR